MSGKIVVNNAVILCNKGSIPSVLQCEVSPFKIGGLSVCTINDHHPTINIQPFGVCTITKFACVPATIAPWKSDAHLSVSEAKLSVLTKSSTLQCTVGGEITVLNPGQQFVSIGLPPLPLENYVLQADDTWAKISEKYGIPLDALLKANHWIDANNVPVGHQLKIPVAVVGWYNNQRYVIYPDGVVKYAGTRAWRNNNPGSIAYGSFAINNGAIGTDGKFAVFPDVETGKNAVSTLLQSEKYKNLTFQEAMEKYAPPHENETEQYINSLVQETGITKNTVMNNLNDNQLNALVEGITVREGFYKEGESYDIFDDSSPDWLQNLP